MTPRPSPTPISDRVHMAGSGWFAAPNWLVEAPELNRSDRDLLTYLLRRAGNDGTCWPSLGRIAADLGVCTRSVRRQLRRLETIGALESEPAWDATGRQTASRYRIVPPPWRAQPGGDDRGGTGDGGGGDLAPTGKETPLPANSPPQGGEADTGVRGEADTSVRGEGDTSVRPIIRTIQNKTQKEPESQDNGCSMGGVSGEQPRARDSIVADRGRPLPPALVIEARRARVPAALVAELAGLTAGGETRALAVLIGMDSSRRAKAGLGAVLNPPGWFRDCMGRRLYTDVAWDEAKRRLREHAPSSAAGPPPAEAEAVGVVMQRMQEGMTDGT